LPLPDRAGIRPYFGRWRTPLRHRLKLDRNRIDIDVALLIGAFAAVENVGARFQPHGQIRPRAICKPIDSVFSRPRLSVAGRPDAAHRVHPRRIRREHGNYRAVRKGQSVDESIHLRTLVVAGVVTSREYGSSAAPTERSTPMVVERVRVSTVTGGSDRCDDTTTISASCCQLPALDRATLGPRTNQSCRRPIGPLFPFCSRSRRASRTDYS